MHDFITRVMGNQLGLHVCDSAPAFSLDVSAMLAAMSSLGRAGTAALTQWWSLGFVLASLNAPVYISAPLNCPEETDSFLEKIYEIMMSACNDRGRTAIELYQFQLEDGSPAYCVVVQIGPLKLRFYWARIGKALYLASKEFILGDLLSANKSADAGDQTVYEDRQSAGHAIVRFRPGNWHDVISDISVNQAENSRVACLKNIVALSASQRASDALAANGSSANYETINTTDRFCPESGSYIAEGQGICCTIHGSVRATRQPSRSSAIKFLQDASAITAQLSFLPDGLRAKLTVDRQVVGTTRLPGEPARNKHKL